jgi:hypothetical protein
MITRAADAPISQTPSGQIRFIENKNQWDPKILYNAKIWAGELFLEKNAFTYYVFNTDDLEKVHFHPDTNAFIIHAHAFKAQFLDANPNPVVRAESPSTTFYNYFTGNDPKHWATGVHDYALVTYDELYPGVDMNVYAFGPNLKYDLIVQPGIDASQIKIQYEGAGKLSIENGNLVIGTSVGNFSEQKPFAYQVIDGNKVEVQCKFNLKGAVVSFSLPKNYDKSLALIIDPTLIFSTYTGSSADNFRLYGHI